MQQCFKCKPSKKTTPIITHWPKQSVLLHSGLRTDYRQQLCTTLQITQGYNKNAEKEQMFKIDRRTHAPLRSVAPQGSSILQQKTIEEKCYQIVKVYHDRHDNIPDVPNPLTSNITIKSITENC